jgi:transposase, IS5 family
MNKPMIRKAEKGLFDEEIRREELKMHKDPLKRLNSVVNWEMFRPTLEVALHEEAKGPGGRPAFDAVMMFKILVLQRVYGLSDEQAEFQIMDRMSFQEFLGLRLADKVPDEKTIWVFRENLKEKKIVESLFETFKTHLESAGLLMKTGVILDATIVDVPRQHNKKEEDETIKRGEIPKEWQKEDNRNKLEQKDTDARWTKKNGAFHFGYKDHIKVDRDSKLIAAYTVTDAGVHDSQETNELLTEEDAWKELHADSAYAGKPIAMLLEAKQIRNAIHESGHRFRPLTEEQKLRNREKSRIRVRVEHVFGFMTTSMKGIFVRVIGKQRARTIIGLTNLTYNLFRYEQLLRLEMKT